MDEVVIRSVGQQQEAHRGSCALGCQSVDAYTHCSLTCTCVPIDCLCTDDWSLSWPVLCRRVVSAPALAMAADGSWQQAVDKSTGKSMQWTR
jgi:hypothetical protein